jgi:hypothetical protein
MPRRVITAAASRYTSRKLKSGQQQKTTDTGWQDRAWAHYDSTPEVRFAAQWISGAMSAATLYAGRLADDGKTIEHVTTGRAAEIVAAIAGGPEGQSQLLGRMGPHLVVPGEGWLVIRPRTDGKDGMEWHVLSVQEVRKQGQKLIAEIDGEDVEVPPADPDGPADDKAPVAIRVWQPHPRRYLEADSPVRASLGVLEELQLLNAAVSAIARSRLTGRGVLLVPKGTRFPSTPVQGDAEDDLIEVFMEVAETAIREPMSASATVPIILEVPAEHIAAIKHLTFESDFDELAIKLRDEQIRRWAAGMDVPAEVLLGMGGINHWGAWQLKEEAIALGVQPRLDTVAHAFTTQWLRPLLDGEPDADRYVVATDTSALRVRGNRSQTALEVFKVGGIGGAARRRETGFTEDDAPTAEEVAARRRTEQQQEEEPGQGEAPAPLPVDESEGEPGTLPASAALAVQAAVLEAADGLIWTALAAAGEKLRRTPACPRSERSKAREIEPARLHTVLRVEPGQVEQWRLLDGAWPRLPEVAARYGLDADCLAASLETYCAELITAGIVHEFSVVPGVVGGCTGRLAVAA